MDLISSMPRAGETALRGWPDDESLERTMTVRHRAHEHIGGAMLPGFTYQIVSRNHLTRVEHADAVSSMRTVEYRRSGKRASGPAFMGDIFHGRFGKTPRASTTCVRTDARLDAIDGARPLREAHVVWTVSGRTLPGRLRFRREGARADVAIGPARARAIANPFEHEMRHERRRHDRVVARGHPIARRLVEIAPEEVAPVICHDLDAITCERRIARYRTGCVAINDEHVLPRDRSGSRGSAKLAHVIAAVTPTADDDDGAKPERPLVCRGGR